MRTVELFAGIGGFRLAADYLGLKTVWANDIDNDAVSVYRDNFGEGSIVQGDVNQLISLIPEHDLLTGGFPCQPFSRAGKKMGIFDYRGTLFGAIVEIVNLRKPKYFILENVNSLLYMNKGENFRTILSALSGCGYKIEWSVLNAVDFGLPQHRERLIIVGSKDSAIDESYFIDKEVLSYLRPVEKYAICDSVNWILINKGSSFCSWGMAFNGKYVSLDIPKKDRPVPCLSTILQSKVDDAFDHTESTLERIKNSTYVNRFFNGVQILYNQGGGARMGYTIYGTEGCAPTLTASTSRHYERYFINGKYRRLTNIEYARLQGFSDLHCKAAKQCDQYRLFGNAVPPQLVEYAMRKVMSRDLTKVDHCNFSLF